MVVQNVMRDCTGGKELKATVQFGEFLPTLSTLFGSDMHLEC